MGGKRSRIIKFLKTEYSIGEKVPTSAIYECSECEKITAFKRGETFLPCEEDHPDEGQHWYRTNQFVRFVSRNLNDEFAKLETVSLKIADFMAEWSGTMGFVYLHILWFGLWIYINTGHSLWGVVEFDPFPFGLLTLIVSLEAIFLSTFILIAQNRQMQKNELRAELDYQTNIKTEKDVAEILAMLNEMREEGKLLEMKTTEVLEEAHIQLEKPKKQKKSHKAQDLMKDAGIPVIRHKKK